MIIHAKYQDLTRIESYVKIDPIRNYFILLGLMKGLSTFQAIYIDESNQIDGILFHRQSGNLQYVSYKPYDTREMQMLIRRLSFKSLISPASFCEQLLPAVVPVKAGATIARLRANDFNDETSKSCENLYPEDCEAVTALYEQVFDGYPKAAYMAEKLRSKRGIGVKLSKDQVIAVAQSDFGNLIVGVATSPAYQNQGYGRQVMVCLLKRLFEDFEQVFLQYDDPIAGKLYDRLGFESIDRVYYYEKEII